MKSDSMAKHKTCTGNKKYGSGNGSEYADIDDADFRRVFGYIPRDLTERIIMSEQLLAKDRSSSGGWHVHTAYLQQHPERVQWGINGRGQLVPIDRTTQVWNAFEELLYDGERRMRQILNLQNQEPRIIQKLRAVYDIRGPGWGKTYPLTGLAFEGTAPVLKALLFLCGRYSRIDEQYR